MSNRELGLPEGATGPLKDESMELLRVWWVGDRPEFVLTPALRDPKNIGRMLYEAAFHFSQVYASNDLGKADELLEQIEAGWQEAHQITMTTVMTKSSTQTDTPAKKSQ